MDYIKKIFKDRDNFSSFLKQAKEYCETHFIPYNVIDNFMVHLFMYYMDGEVKYVGEYYH